MTLSSLRVSCDPHTISMLTFTCCNVKINNTKILKYTKNPAFYNFAKGGYMCPLPPAHMSLIRKDSGEH
jgi:hypothetical protein